MINLLGAAAPRARQLGLSFGDSVGPFNAITDVAGVEVGYCTLIEGEGCRTGVTAILPRGRQKECEPVRAGIHSFNGNGEMTGSHWIREVGHFIGPIGLTNTYAVGAVHEGLTRWLLAQHPASQGEFRWFLPVVAETWDGYLNDIECLFVRPGHVAHAIATAKSGIIAEGNVGGGTGMRCYGFKGGSGTSSRIVPGGNYTVGAFVQANFGSRSDLTMRGLTIGQNFVEDKTSAEGSGSVIVILATDAPLNASQLSGLARRATLGIGRTGTPGQHESGDIFLAFSTARLKSTVTVDDRDLSPIFAGAVDAVEEAVLNALVAATGMTGYRGRSVDAIDHELIRRVVASGKPQSRIAE